MALMVGLLSLVRVPLVWDMVVLLLPFLWVVVLEVGVVLCWVHGGLLWGVVWGCGGAVCFGVCVLLLACFVLVGVVAVVLVLWLLVLWLLF